MSYATTIFKTMLVWMVLCVLTAPAAFAQGNYSTMVTQNKLGHNLVCVNFVFDLTLVGRDKYFPFSRLIPSHPYRP